MLAQEKPKNQTEESKNQPDSEPNQEIRENAPTQTNENLPPPVSIHFRLMGGNVLELDLAPHERLADLVNCIKEDPLVSLLRNFQFKLDGQFVNPSSTLGELASQANTTPDNSNDGENETPGQNDENTQNEREGQTKEITSPPLLIELSPGPMNNFTAQQSLLSFIRLVQDPKVYLASKAFALFEVVNRQDWINLATQHLDFTCKNLNLENSLQPDLSSALQYLTVEKNDQSVQVSLQATPPAFASNPDLKFLRSLKLHAKKPDFFVAEEDYFQLEVETLEAKHLLLVFCRRGVYIAQDFDRMIQGSQKRRQSGYYSSIIAALSAHSPLFAQHFQEFFTKYSSFKKSKTDPFHMIELILTCDFQNNSNQHRFWLDNDELMELAHLSPGISSFP